MKFIDTQILAKLFKDIYKEYQNYEDDADINNNDADLEDDYFGNLYNLKCEIQDRIGNSEFSIVAAVLCHKVGIEVKNIDNPNFSFNNITEKDYQSNSFIINYSESRECK